MEEGLKVILSADVSNFQEAFSRAAQTAKQQVNSINQTLASTGKAAETAAKTWNQFVGEKMSAAMKQFGSHGAAIRAIAAEWAVYKQAVAQAGAAGTGIGQTAQAVQKVAQAMGAMKQVKLPSTEGVVLGLNKAESALKKLAAGESYVRDLDRSIKLLVASTQTLGGTPEIDQLVSALQRLQASKQQLNATGLDIKPNVDVADTLRAIERIKDTVAGDQFRFNLTADSKSLQGAMVQATQATQAAVKDINTVLSTVNFAPPSTASLVQGLAQAEAAVKRFSTGSASVEDLNNAILQLTRSKEGLSNTGAVDKLITRLQALHTTAASVQAAGLNINPTVNVADTLRDIERIKGLIAGQEFSFTLSADGKPLQASMAQAVDSTQGAEQAIGNATKGVSESFNWMTQAARLSVGEYIKALGQMDSVPTAIKTTVQAPDMTPVLRAVEQVKSSIKTATEASLPRLTLLADTAPFNSALAGSQAAAREAAQTIGTSFDQIGAATSGAASKAAANVAELIRNFNQMKGANPNVLTPNIVPPNFGPMVQAAKQAKLLIDRTFATPLPALKVPQVVPPRGLPQLTKESNDAQFALMNLSRVAQDAPFGFMGIANNINPLLESFQKLKATSGSTGGALKALAGSLAGPAGLGLAVGVASSLLVVFGDKLLKAFKTSNLFKEAIKEAVTNVGETVVKLELYKNKLNDVNLSAEQRIKVAKEYNKIADETNKIDLKQIENLTEINKKIDAQNTLILRRALSAAAMSKLTEASNKLIENELKFQAELDKRGLKESDVVKMGEQRAKAAKEEKDARERVNGVVQQGLDGVRNYSREAAKAAGVTEDAILQLYNSIQQGRADLQKEAGKLSGFITVPGLTTQDPVIKPKVDKQPAEDALKKLSDYVKNMNLEAQVDFSAVPGGGTPKDWAKDYIESLKQQFNKEVDIPINISFTGEQVKANALASSVDKVFTEMIEKFRDAEVGFPTIDLDAFVKEGGAEQLKEYLDGMLSTATDFRTKMQNILSSTATDAMSGFAEGIAKAMETGDISAGFKGLISVIGDAVTQIGKALIEYGVVKSGLDKILAAGIAIPGGFAIAAGVTAVAAGQLIKSSFKAFDQGGIVYGPTMGLVGEYAGASSNPEVIAPLSKLKDMIKGTGGDKFPAYLPMHTISGSTLRLWYARADRSARRFY